MTYSVPSHQMRHLPGVWDDVFDCHAPGNACLQCATGGAKSITSMLHVQVYTITKAFSLDYECTGKSQCRKVTGQFVLPLHMCTLGMAHCLEYKYVCNYPTLAFEARQPHGKHLSNFDSKHMPVHSMIH